MAHLQLHALELAAGEAVERPGPVAVYDVAAAAASFRRGEPYVAARDGHVLVFSLVDEPVTGAALSAELALDGVPLLLRCDRVDFPPGGVAFLHTHQGPGIRCLVAGAFAVETNGARRELEPFGAWFEAGPDPVYAEVRGDAPAAFVRTMVLPARLLGSPSIRYVRDEDRERPKSQRYTVYLDEPL